MTSSARYLPLIVTVVLSCSVAVAQESVSISAFKAAPPEIQQLTSITGSTSACIGGSASGYACDKIDLLSFLDLSIFGSSGANDIWGWTDPDGGNEYAIIGLKEGTGFVNVTNPVNPVYVGILPAHGDASSWRDIKVYQNHAFVVSEEGGHGIQIFDLTQLRTAETETTFGETAHYDALSQVHNIVINESTGFAYAVGNRAGTSSNDCAGGLHMINIQDPLNPVFAGCFDGDGYTHDAQCVLYTGPDVTYQGREICVALNENTITIVDVTDKSSPVQLSRIGYPARGYIHQGWFTDDQIYFYQDDETDGGNTRTVIWDVADLTDPVLVANHYAALSTKDHNQYVIGDRVYQSNYTAGLRILDISSRLAPIEIAYFDTYTPNNGTSYNGSWSNYPFFASGTIVVSSIGEGLFVLKYNDVPPPTANEIHVYNIVEGTQGGKKRQRGTATVTIRDDHGNTVSGATVSGTFSGAFNESGSGTTDSNGNVTLVTGGQSRTPTFSFCVDDVQGSVPYNNAANSDSAYACSAGPGGTPSSTHIAFIETGQQGAGRGQKYGKAIVTLVDNLGGSVADAAINGTFSGDFGDTGVATTNSDGVATFTTAQSKKGTVTVSFCVNTVTASPGYVSGENADPSYQCGGGTRKTALAAASASLPETFFLAQNYPNPFNPSTVISYSVPESGLVMLQVHDILGRLVRTLVRGYREAATYNVVFDASDLPAGSYMYVINSGTYSATKRMTLLK